MATTRREFLKLSAMGVSVSILAPQILVPRAFGAGIPVERTLVILQLAGGNDTVNTIIPYTDSRYRSFRPNLAIADSQILKVDSQLGFHPSMESLVPLYEQGKFTFVNNVGFETLDRSHFHCEDVWQTANEDVGHDGQSLGWVGRYADLYLGEGSSSVTSVSIGNSVPLGMRAADVYAAAIRDAGEFDIRTHGRDPGEIDRFRESVRFIYGVPGPSETESIRAHGSDMFETIDLVRTLPGPSEGVEYPATDLGEAFTLAAQIIAAELGTRAIWIKTGGFDTHALQLTTHANLLADVADSLSAFQADLLTRGLSNQVVVMAWSEFGRRVQENASDGTDHGKAGTVFLLGEGVRGGTFYGDVPRLDSLDSGDLPTRIDFRSVYSTLLEDWLGVDPEPVLGQVYANLGFIRPPGADRKRPVRR